MHDTKLRFEPVHDLEDYYDGPRAGIANFRGSPYRFQSRMLDVSGPDDAVDMFDLAPLDSSKPTAVASAVFRRIGSSPLPPGEWPRLEVCWSTDDPRDLDCAAFECCWGYRPDPREDLLLAFPGRSVAEINVAFERATHLLDAVHGNPFHGDPHMPTISQAVRDLRGAVSGVSDDAYGTAADKICYLYMK